MSRYYPNELLNFAMNKIEDKIWNEYQDPFGIEVMTFNYVYLNKDAFFEDGEVWLYANVLMWNHYDDYKMVVAIYHDGHIHFEESRRFFEIVGESEIDISGSFANNR